MCAIRSGIGTRVARPEGRNPSKGESPLVTWGNDRRMDLEAIARYRREGYLVVPGVLDHRHIDECLAALTDLATDPALEAGQRDGRGAFIALEPGADATAAPRADL